MMFSVITVKIFVAKDVSKSFLDCIVVIYILGVLGYVINCRLFLTTLRVCIK